MTMQYFWRASSSITLISTMGSSASFNCFSAVMRAISSGKFVSAVFAMFATAEIHGSVKRSIPICAAMVAPNLQQ